MKRASLLEAQDEQSWPQPGLAPLSLAPRRTPLSSRSMSTTILKAVITLPIPQRSKFRCGNVTRSVQGQLAVVQLKFKPTHVSVHVFSTDCLRKDSFGLVSL